MRMVDTSATLFEFLASVEYLRLPVVIFNESVTPSSALARELFK